LIELIGTAVTLGIAGGGSKTTFCIPQIMAKAVAAISGYGMPACGLRRASMERRSRLRSQ
jgi:hypothetical protein